MRRGWWLLALGLLLQWHFGLAASCSPGQPFCFHLLEGPSSESSSTGTFAQDGTSSSVQAGDSSSSSATHSSAPSPPVSSSSTSTSPPPTTEDTTVPTVLTHIEPMIKLGSIRLDFKWKEGVLANQVDADALGKELAAAMGIAANRLVVMKDPLEVVVDILEPQDASDKLTARKAYDKLLVTLADTEYTSHTTLLRHIDAVEARLTDYSTPTMGNIFRLDHPLPFGVAIGILGLYPFAIYWFAKHPHERRRDYIDGPYRAWPIDSSLSFVTRYKLAIYNNHLWISAVKTADPRSLWRRHERLACALASTCAGLAAAAFVLAYDINFSFILVGGVASAVSWPIGMALALLYSRKAEQDGRRVLGHFVSLAAIAGSAVVIIIMSLKFHHPVAPGQPPAADMDVSLSWAMAGGVAIVGHIVLFEPLIILIGTGMAPQLRKNEVNDTAEVVPRKNTKTGFSSKATSEAAVDDEEDAPKSKEAFGSKRKGRRDTMTHGLTSIVTEKVASNKRGSINVKNGNKRRTWNKNDDNDDDGDESPKNKTPVKRSTAFRFNDGDEEGEAEDTLSPIQKAINEALANHASSSNSRGSIVLNNNRRSIVAKSPSVDSLSAPKSRDSEGGVKRSATTTSFLSPKRATIGAGGDVNPLIAALPGKKNLRSSSTTPSKLINKSPSTSSFATPKNVHTSFSAKRSKHTRSSARTRLDSDIEESDDETSESSQSEDERKVQRKQKRSSNKKG